MPDISKCDIKCEKSSTCYRSWAKPSEWGQAWFANDPRNSDKSCDYYWHRIKPENKES